MLIYCHGSKFCLRMFLHLTYIYISAYSVTYFSLDASLKGPQPSKLFGRLFFFILLQIQPSGFNDELFEVAKSLRRTKLSPEEHIIVQTIALFFSGKNALRSWLFSSKKLFFLCASLLQNKVDIGRYDAGEVKASPI